MERAIQRHKRAFLQICGGKGLGSGSEIAPINRGASRAITRSPLSYNYGITYSTSLLIAGHVVKRPKRNRLKSWRVLPTNTRSAIISPTTLENLKP
jgi:hypothetical protein